MFPDGTGLSRLAAMLTEGRLVLDLTSTYAFSKVHHAHDHLERGVGRGKLLLPPGAEPR